MVRLTCKLCRYEVTVHPKLVRPSRAEHDRAAHPLIEARRQELMAELLPVAHLTVPEPEHIALVDQLNALDDHWDYVNLDAPRWPTFPA